jgi:hypothetical protein
MLKKRSFCAAGILFFSSACAHAQALPQPGEWAFVVTTDLKSVPADMSDNFPVVDYEKCLTAEEISSPRAFGLQASPAMWNRCSTENWKMEAGKLAYSFQCDGGATLSGEVAGDYAPMRVTLNLVSRPLPIVRGVETIHQRIVAKRLGACKNPT